MEKKEQQLNDRGWYHDPYACQWRHDQVVYDYSDLDRISLYTSSYPMGKFAFYASVEDLLLLNEWLGQYLKQKKGEKTTDDKEH